MTNTYETNDGLGGAVEVLGVNSLEAINRSEIDMQIATAKKYPRSMTVFRRRAIELATHDEETAESCMYSVNVGGGKFATGKSIRMAEIVGASYGNIRCSATIIDQTERQVTARGMCIDLETNFASSSEIVESTVTKEGRPYSERQRLKVAKVALAKAWRDAMFRVVPGALCKPIEDAARGLVVGDGTTASISKRRAKVMAWVHTLGIDDKRVFAALGIGGEDDIGIDQLTTLTGIKTRIKDQEATVDESFPLPDIPPVPPVGKTKVG